MDLAMAYEIIGYIASVLVAISLMMSSILKLRVINLIGAAFFTLYGLLIGAYPVAAVNFIIVLIDLYYLYQIFATDEYFVLLEVPSDSEYLKYFLNFYEQEIKKFFPKFAYTPSERQFVFFVLRDLVSAGLFIGEVRDEDSLFVKLDFVIPGYRDFKIGKFVYAEKADFFKEKGFRKLYAEAEDKKHNDYLQRIGFTPIGSTDGVTSYSLVLD